MSFNVTFYSFSKKLNSTIRPDNTVESITYSCDIKGGSGVVNPVLLLSYDFNNKIENLYNYCYIPIWKRYYFIKNYKYSSGLWEITLNVDVLASWKEYIENSILYIERSFSEANGDLVDSITIGKAFSTINNIATYSLFTNADVSILGGTYVIGVKGKDPTGLLPSSAITYYGMDQKAMENFINNLTNSASTTYTDISAEILKSSLDPFQFLVSCKWYPFNLYSQTTKVSTIPLGWFNIPISTGNCCTVGFNYIKSVDNITVPKHPQYATAKGLYLNNKKFHTIYAYLPGRGLEKLESDNLVSKEKMYITLMVDIYTGDAIYTIKTDNDSTPLYYFDAKIGVDYPLTAFYSASRQNASNFIERALDTIGQVLFPVATTKTLAQWATDDYEAGGWDALHKAGAVANLIGNPSTLTANYSGIMGARAFFYYRPSITIFSIDTPVQLPSYSDVGYPLYKHAKIGDYSGYLKIIDAHCEAPATSHELVLINDFLNGGFFNE